MQVHGRTSGPQAVPAGDVLESWKMIAAYLRRDVRTLQRWECNRRLPIHRVPGGGKAAVYALKSELDTWWQSAGTISARCPADSIAVLPFVNLGGNKRSRYFGDALADEIITGLTRLPGVQVTAWASSAAFRNAETDVSEIGVCLHAAVLLEGGVRISGGHVRVWAQLVDSASGYHLWSERYDRDLGDEFAVEEDIARTILGAIQIRVATP